MIRMYSVEFFFIRSMNVANSDVGVIEDDHYTEKEMCIMKERSSMKEV